MSLPSMHYRVDLTQPQRHCFEVTVTVRAWTGEPLRLCLPVWTPGSYLVREYSRHLQDFSAEGPEAELLPWRKTRKNHWRIEAAGAETVVVRFRMLATDLTVRTNHLDGTHGFFTPAALLPYVPELRQQPSEVEIVAPEGWQAFTALPSAGPHCFRAEDYDQLVDSPFEVGPLTLRTFEAGGRPHGWVTWGRGEADWERLLADTRQIIETEAALFGGLPYERYLFILHLSGGAYGGLEHRDSTVLAYDRHSLAEPDGYRRFLQLVAHEFFHLWNVKRLRPRALEVFDYDRENYTPSLWFCEGVTSYYDPLLPLRAGCYGVDFFLECLGKDLSRYLTTPGRFVQPLTESSTDAWIKLYRRDAWSDNQQMSYYLKGQLVTMLLDLEIQRRQPERNFDEVLRRLWQSHGQPERGYDEAELRQLISDVAGADLSDCFADWLDGLAELPLVETLATVGLTLTPTLQPHPYHGLKLADEGGRCRVKAVLADSPAETAGLEPGDELLALDGFRVGAESLGKRLKSRCPGDRLSLSVFHGDELLTRTLVLADPQPASWSLTPNPEATAAQRQAFRRWTGCDLPA